MKWQWINTILNCTHIYAYYYGHLRSGGAIQNGKAKVAKDDTKIVEAAQGASLFAIQMLCL